jgi:hypothetical protein
MEPYLVLLQKSNLGLEMAVKMVHAFGMAASFEDGTKKKSVWTRRLNEYGAKILKEQFRPITGVRSSDKNSVQASGEHAGYQVKEHRDVIQKEFIARFHDMIAVHTADKIIDRLPAAKNFDRSLFDKEGLGLQLFIKVTHPMHFKRLDLQNCTYAFHHVGGAKILQAVLESEKKGNIRIELENPWPTEEVDTSSGIFKNQKFQRHSNSLCNCDVCAAGSAATKA